MVIVSPTRLADGTPFPTYAWLTCPWLIERAGVRESAGETAEWAARAVDDEGLAARLIALDAELRAVRAAEGPSADVRASSGIAGQRDPLGVKCLHAHLALALLGLDDPIGLAILGDEDDACEDVRCDRLASESRSR